MNNALLIPLLCAILGPFLEGLMNIVDKYVLAHKVKRPSSFAIVSGAYNIFAGLLLASILDWSAISSLKEILFPAIAGAIFGSQYLVYFHLLSKEDVSNVIGLLYVYPIVVAVLSFFFLNEQFSLFVYVGMGLILIGGVMLSGGIKRFNKKFGFLLGLMILLVALHEFFIKVATTNLPVMNGIAVGLTCTGLAIMTGLVHGETRQGVREEFRNIIWVFLSDSLAFAGLAAIYFAMAGLPATIVATIAATQPLTVLFLEKLFHKCGIKICSDERLLPKLIPISAIVIGIVIMYQVVEP